MNREVRHLENHEVWLINFTLSHKPEDSDSCRLINISYCRLLLLPLDFFNSKCSSSLQPGNYQLFWGFVPTWWLVTRMADPLLLCSRLCWGARGRGLQFLYTQGFPCLICLGHDLVDFMKIMSCFTQKHTPQKYHLCFLVLCAATLPKTISFSPTPQLPHENQNGHVDKTGKPYINVTNKTDHEKNTQNVL